MSDETPFSIRPSAYQLRLKARMAAQGLDTKGNPLTDQPKPRKPISFDGAPMRLGDDTAPATVSQPQPVQAAPAPVRGSKTGFVFPNTNYEVFDI